MSNVLTCVYCGHEYPEGTPPHGSQILTDHIKICEKHPMRKLELENAHLKQIILNRSSEQEVLGDIFGHDKWLNQFKLWWCDLCDTFSIGCNNDQCHGSSCNTSGCSECTPIYEDFHKAKTHVWEYLSADERKIYDKIFWLKRYMKESLSAGEYEINWKRFKEQGEMSKNTSALFASEIAASVAAQPDIKFGDY